MSFYKSAYRAVHDGCISGSAGNRCLTEWSNQVEAGEHQQGVGASKAQQQSTGTERQLAGGQETPKASRARNRKLTGKSTSSWREEGGRGSSGNQQR